MNLRDRYLGSKLGLFWAILNPLLLLGMYTFVFGFVLKAKVPGAKTTFAYSIWMISGFVPYLAFSEALVNSSNAIISGKSLIKNIIFKSEILPIAATMTAGVPFIVGMFFLVVLLCLDGNYPTWHSIAIVPVIVAQFTFLIGLSLYVSATAVFIRDIIQMLPTLIMLLLFFTPIFYPIQSMPPIIRKLTFFNPLYQMSIPYRNILLKHYFPDWKGLVYLGILGICLVVSGLEYFRYLKGYFDMRL